MGIFTFLPIVSYTARLLMTLTYLNLTMLR